MSNALAAIAWWTVASLVISVVMVPSINISSTALRESTEPLQDPGLSALDYLPRLLIGFSDIPRTDKGLIFGSNKNCDIQLPFPGVSNIHFSLTFDEFNRPIIKDLNSLRGTQITYTGKGRASGGISNGSLAIVTQPHDIQSPEYIDGVRRFRQGTAATEDLLEDLGLSYPPTRGAQTPGTGDISLRKTLGEGAFGVVTHLWNVSTGEERVAIQNGQFNPGTWKREAYIMSLVSHERIVKLIESFSTPHYELHIEYMPYGSLEDHDDISYDETLMIVHQCSSALAYLHDFETPIAHRDIKPANILVESRSEYSISVKLGDFGLSRHSSELMTFCGTYLYLAPEVYSDMRSQASYTVAVDIWSLGVVGCRLVYGLPHYKDEYKKNRVAWCEKIVKAMQRKVDRQPTALGSILVECMVVLSPDTRSSAGYCCSALENLLQPEQGFSQQLASSTYSREEDQETLRYASLNDDAGNLSTIICQPRPTRAVTPSLFIRSRAPPPESLLLSKVNPHYGESEVPLSSAIRHYNSWQAGHEMTRFVEDYSVDPLNSLYVGSSLASHLVEDNPEEWASDFLGGSSQQNQGWAGGLETATVSESRIPRGGSGGWRVASGPEPVEEGNAIDAEDYDERANAALMLQALGQGQWSNFEVCD
ncbi:kinase-like domain-containing protein [Colletotrichum godetiae]|uniref:Kinase-like domain-containing protein n=1 Tax=Colletotrichum godetiae TaxID=1209918 RepID=A0AAJ0A764_9PEZI|nr:kinase-like domain-containing protein [Colletotrichum godetiae]KAK1657740.1 kinase-like domain-containing protein [Colletotrichum godetiae]